MYKYIVYKPSSADARVRAQRETCYYDTGHEALYAGVEIYSVDLTRVPDKSWMDDTDTEVTYTRGLKIIQGSDVNNGFSLEATYEGMSVSFNNETKTFGSTETPDSRTLTFMRLNVLHRRVCGHRMECR